MSITRTLGRATVVVAALALTPAVVSAGDDRGRNEPHLLGRAVLPVTATAPGPTSGQFVPQSPRPPVSFPIVNAQPVEGFSGIVAGRKPGEYLAMPDNGFGGKANSVDFLVRAYYIQPDFKTARGGTGRVAVGDFIQFRDPHNQFRDPRTRRPFPIVNEGQRGRLLTGGDIDPESIQRDYRGHLWLGDEFGPWLLHFDATGVLLEPPIELPGNLVSPNHPNARTDTNPRGRPVTVANSRGIEALAISPNGRTLTVVLEGAVTLAPNGDHPASRRIYQYDLVSETFTRRADYRVNAPAGQEGNRFVSDVQALDNHRFVLIERDGGLGPTATYRRVYAIDLNKTYPAGTVLTTQVVDLAAIPDPDLVSLPPLHRGDIGLGDPFQVTCESIEALHVVSHAELLLGCDNNLPNYGRNPDILDANGNVIRRGLADDNEFILVKAPGL
jgi:glycerophosphoryl diester phosphodiesterase